MTKRLEEAIRRLTPQQVEQLTAYIESFAGESTTGSVTAPTEAKLTWVGCLKDGPYRSGLEAQEAAKHIRSFLVERALGK
jgi:hypothetical protein